LLPGDNGNGNVNGNSHSSITAIAPEPTSTRADNSTSAKALSRLRSIVLLGGSLRQTELGTSIGRAILDLPIDESGSIFNHWLAHAAELAQCAGLKSLPVQVLVSHNTPEPISASARYAGSFRVLRDQSEYRGTGGVLRDL